MTCRELADRVGVYRAGELPVAARASLLFHAWMCPCCRALLSTYDVTLALSVELAEQQVPEEVAREFDRMIERAMAPAS